jgi:hypothetical protein
MNPLKEERRLCGAALKTAEVLQTYYILRPLQVERGVTSRNGEVKGRAADVFHEEDERCCHRCGTIVTNFSLGGHSRKSALAGDVWCYHCAN